MLDVHVVNVVAEAEAAAEADDFVIIEAGEPLVAAVVAPAIAPVAALVATAIAAAIAAAVAVPVAAPVVINN